MKQKDLLFLLVSASSLVFAWIVFSIYHNLATPTISQTLETSISPINPAFDKKTLEALKRREKAVPVYKLQNEPLSPTPIQSGPTPISSPSAESSLTPEKQATQEGELLP
ncbi:MAG: hypothetical protein Q8Q96_00990 [bacterium]|nr:hypothetical protein [bacterium]